MLFIATYLNFRFFAVTGTRWMCGKYLWKHRENWETPYKKDLEDWRKSRNTKTTENHISQFDGVCVGVSPLVYTIYTHTHTMLCVHFNGTQRHIAFHLFHFLIEKWKLFFINERVQRPATNSTPGEEPKSAEPNKHTLTHERTYNKEQTHRRSMAKREQFHAKWHIVVWKLYEWMILGSIP